MDRDVWVRASHRRAPRPTDPPCQHPRDEWRQLSPRAKPGPKNRQPSSVRSPTLQAGNSGRATPSRRSPLAAQSGLLLRRPMADFYSAVDNSVFTEGKLTELYLIWRNLMNTFFHDTYPRGGQRVMTSDDRRGGRMTKWKGRAASFAPQLGHLPIVLAASVTLVLPSHQALAQFVADGTAVNASGWSVFT